MTFKEERIDLVSDSLSQSPFAYTKKHPKGQPKPFSLTTPDQKKKTLSPMQLAREKRHSQAVQQNQELEREKLKTILVELAKVAELLDLQQERFKQLPELFLLASLPVREVISAFQLTRHHIKMVLKAVPDLNLPTEASVQAGWQAVAKLYAFYTSTQGKQLLAILKKPARLHGFEPQTFLPLLEATFAQLSSFVAVK